MTLTYIDKGTFSTFMVLKFSSSYSVSVLGRRIEVKNKRYSKSYVLLSLTFLYSNIQK